MSKKKSDPEKKRKAGKSDGVSAKTLPAPVAILPPGLPVLVPKSATVARPVKPKAPKKPAAKPKSAPKKKTAPRPVISTDDIALRAYYIAERRQKMGWPGDSTSDWVEAERQLIAEAKKAKS
jgi:hypothetical protein